MSRCYPYPPLGFVKDGGQWIDCIKLQREREKIKTEIQKEKKREKEKRKSDRGKKISTDTGHGKRRKLDYQKCDEQERSKEKSLGAHIQKRIEAEAEQLERSGITDEHEQPTCSINVCSDSLQGSNKRIRDSSPTSGLRSHGTIVRIRLHSKGQDNEKLRFTCGRADDFHAQHKNGSVNFPSQEQGCFTNTKENILAEKLNIRPKKEATCPVPGRHETTTSYKNEIPAESLYRTSIENWVLPPPQYHQGNDFSDDEEWLFKTQRENRYECERYEARNDAIGCRSPMLRPRAYFLPEADVYALPYTVPF
ncbi:hypothetical protein I3843_08G067700 [Carya illinoinensis]|nr:hypothetical protein I3843_08G067700 [Carya illinoinensis]